jgi:glyoxylase-like metal-dependent hydrolase (beta-lactamase superfamily II)
VVLTFLPGHTSGQMGLLLDRSDARALFCGDAIHSPVQLLQPAVSTSSCRDGELAARTRRVLLHEAAANGRVLVPAHFRGARRATVTAKGDGFLPVLSAPSA